MSVTRVPIPILALVAIAILFGHDALMAAGTHEAGAGHHQEHEVPATECHVLESVRPAQLDQSDSPAVEKAPCVDPGMQGVAEQRQTRWDLPPRHPPATLRAMLQVFLN